MTEFYNEDLVEGILRDRYYSNGETSWAEVSHRVSRYVASGGVTKGLEIGDLRGRELAYEEMINRRLFLPNSPTLFNAGVNTNQALIKMPVNYMTYNDYVDVYNSRDRNGCLSACFVVPVEDSMKGIYESLTDAALITKSGGGVGFSFSRLRPKGSIVGGTGGTSSGPIAFMEVFDKSAHVVRQGGRRRAAMMAVLRYDHPDILDFIHSKRKNDGASVLSYFNISVDVDPDKFLKLYRDDGDIILTHERTSETEVISAREFMRLIAENAWRSGDPGMVFTERHNRYSAISDIVKFESTNPCGEQYLQPYGSCNLGSIDIARTEKEGITSTVAGMAVDFLDDVVDVNSFPLEQIDIVNRYNRDIGLGVMGVHDLLISLLTPYDSADGRHYIAKVMANIAYTSYERSMQNAIRYGSAPAFESSRFKDDGFVPFSMINSGSEILCQTNEAIVDLMDKIREFGGLRNMSIGSVAPTGTLSLLAETSSGIEPHFAFSYTRFMRTKDGGRTELQVIPQSALSFGGYNEDILRETGSLVQAYENRVDGYIPKTAQEIGYEDHLLMQATVQAYISNAVSKTINLHNQATVEDVEKAYLMSMRYGCKGVTVYRDGSLSEQVLETKEVPRREDVLEGKTKVHRDNERNTYVTVNFDEDGNLVEVFITGDGKTPEYIGRNISMHLRNGLSWEEVYSLHKKTGGYYEEICDTINDTINGDNIHSDENWVDTNKGFSVGETGDTKCNSCGGINSIVAQAGCFSCLCGWAMCSA